MTRFIIVAVSAVLLSCSVEAKPFKLETETYTATFPCPGGPTKQENGDYQCIQDGAVLRVSAKNEDWTAAKVRQLAIGVAKDNGGTVSDVSQTKDHSVTFVVDSDRELIVARAFLRVGRVVFAMGRVPVGKANSEMAYRRVMDFVVDGVVAR